MSSEEEARNKLTETLDMIRNLFKKRDDELDDLINDCSYETKLAITKWVMKHIVDHAREGGSFRTLIYERLGFGPDAYVPLCSDGMTISNEFDLSLKAEVIGHLKNGDIDAAKRALGCCDEPGCFEQASAGIPTKEKYRWVCHEHSKGLG